MHTHPPQALSNARPRRVPTVGRARAACLALAFVLLAVALRTHQLAGKSLWLDEAFSVWMSDQPLSNLRSWTLQIDQHPPLYYLLLRAWVQIGGPFASPTARAFWVRLPSAGFGTLTVAVFYALGRRFAGRSAGLLAALILALSPFHVWFGQEARMYALLALNASLAALGLARLFLPPVQATAGCRGTERGRAGWTLYILFTAATLWTHNTALLFWAATNLFFLAWLALARAQETGFPSNASLPGNPVSRLAVRWLLAQLAVLLLWAPWLRPFLQQAAGVAREFWLPAPTWSAVGDALNTFLSAHLPSRAAWWGLAWLAFGVLFLAGACALRRKPDRLALLVTLFFTPLLGELLVSLRRPIFYTRTLIGTSLPLYLLLAAGAAAAGRQGRYRAATRAAARAATWAALALLLIANARSLHNYYSHFVKEAWDQAAEYVSQRAQSGDLILYHASWVQLPFDFYFAPPASTSVVERGLPLDLFDRGALEPKMTEQDLPRLEALLQGHSRAWLVYSHNWYTDPQGLIPAALARAGDLEQRRRFHGVDVYLFKLPK